MGETRDPRVGDLLTAALSDLIGGTDACGRWTSRTAGPRSVDPLMPRFAMTTGRCASAVDALAALGDRRAIPPLQQVAARDSREFVRAEARNAIVVSNDHHVVIGILLSPRSTEKSERRHHDRCGVPFLG